MNRIQEKYKKEVIPAMRKEFGYKNIMSVPKLIKAVVNTGTGRVAKDEKMLAVIERDLTMLTGQKPLPTLAKKSIASFKIREGMPIGYKITLRGKRLYDFVDRLISIALPRTRDFRGISKKAFSEGGVLNLGISEQAIFPEIHYETLKDVFPLQVSIVSTASNQNETLALFRSLGFPIQK